MLWSSTVQEAGLLIIIGLEDRLNHIYVGEWSEPVHVLHEIRKPAATDIARDFVYRGRSMNTKRIGYIREPTRMRTTR